MTKNELMEMINENSRVILHLSDLSVMADRILAALQKEREGEIVLWQGTAKRGEPEFMMRQGRGDNHSVALFPVDYLKVKNKTGQLIFKPIKEGV